MDQVAEKPPLPGQSPGPQPLKRRPPGFLSGSLGFPELDSDLPVNGDAPVASLAKEIARLRRIMDRALEMAISSDHPRDLLHLMDIYSMAATRLANLVKSQQELEQKQGGDSLFQIALREVQIELGLRPPDQPQLPESVPDTER